jgi:hypothetical protein
MTTKKTWMEASGFCRCSLHLVSKLKFEEEKNNSALGKQCTFVGKMDHSISNNAVSTAEVI